MKQFLNLTLFGGRLTEMIMQNLSSKLLTINEIAEQVFQNDLQETYVISIWDNEITFSSHYQRETASRAMRIDGAVAEIDGSGFTTIEFRHTDIKVKIVLS